MKDKKIIITLSIIIVLVLTIGVTYSIFTTTKTSKNSNLVVGDIYMHYNETNQIQMENAMPMKEIIVNPIMATQEYTSGGTNELSKCVDGFISVGASTDEALSLCKGGTSDGLTMQKFYDQGYLDEMNLTNTFIEANVLILNSNIPYFEFTIDGKNTTKDKDIWYEIVLSKGDELSGKTRIKDNLLKFRLTETKDNKETVVVNNKSYDDLTNKRIWVDTIDKNTTSEVVHTYRLYMWISNDTVIGNVNQDYTMEEWKNVFASIKVGVTGDFNEKSINVEVDSSCFKTETNDTGLTITDYNSSCGNRIIIPETINGEKVTIISSNAFDNKNLVSITIPSSVTTISPYAFTNNKITSINVPDTVTSLHCKSFDEGVVKNRDMTCGKDSCFMTVTNSDNTVTISGYDLTCGTDVIIPSTINNMKVTAIADCNTRAMSNKLTLSPNNLNNYTNKKYTLKNANNQFVCSFMGAKLTSVIMPDSVTTIGSYAFQDNQLTSVEIPDSVTTIGSTAFYGNQLTSVTIPDSVTTIGSTAFYGNQLTSITISNSVTTIGDIAFDGNQLTSVTIGSGIKYIGRDAFDKGSSSNPNLASITINKSCSDIKNITKSNSSTSKYYPWLSYSSPYTTSGVTMYGSNNEVCDSF